MRMKRTRFFSRPLLFALHPFPCQRKGNRMCEDFVGGVKLSSTSITRRYECAAPPCFLCRTSHRVKPITALCQQARRNSHCCCTLCFAVIVLSPMCVSFPRLAWRGVFVECFRKTKQFARSKSNRRRKFPMKKRKRVSPAMACTRAAALALEKG